MKIGILTFHDGINHGAFLQVYSLHKTIDALGYPNFVINYKNFSHFKNEYGGLLNTYYPNKFFRNAIKILRFWAFQRRHMNLTRFMFNYKKINALNFDIIFVGSDEVWNFNNPAFGLDPVYFGVGLNTKKLISYAASFGAQKNKESMPAPVREGINRFHAISVRDKNSLKMASSATRKKISLVADPTFLYDFSTEDKAAHCAHSDFIVLYSPILDNEDITSIKAYMKTTGMPLISIGYHHEWCDINIPYLDPFKWIAYIKNARAVITSTFHGTIFSIKYRKEFCTIIKPYWRHKIESILIDLALEGRVVKADNKIDRIFSERIDYDRVHTILDKEIKDSMLFLKESIIDI